MNCTIQMWGNSAAIRIPKWALEASGITVGNAAVITAEAGKLSIEKAIAPISMESLFEGYAGDYKPEEIDFGAPVGKEII